MYLDPIYTCLGLYDVVGSYGVGLKPASVQWNHIFSQGEFRQRPLALSHRSLFSYGITHTHQRPPVKEGSLTWPPTENVLHAVVIQQWIVRLDSSERVCAATAMPPMIVCPVARALPLNTKALIARLEGTVLALESIQWCSRVKRVWCNIQPQAYCGKQLGDMSSAIQ
jgi:hypothetical protein